MANTNTLTTAIPQLLAQGLLALRQMAVMPRFVNRGYETLAGEKGSTIDINIPSAITAQSVTPSYVPPDDAGVVPTKVSMTLNSWYEAPFFLSDNDLLQVMNGFIPMQASEAVKALANQIDNDILALVESSVYGFSGTAGTTPFAADLSEFLTADQVLNDQLAPLDPRYVVLNSKAKAQVKGLRAVQDAAWRGTTDGMQRNDIGDIMGYFWAMDQNVKRHTSGTWTNAGTASGANSAGQGVVNLTGGTGSILVGDIVVMGTTDLQTYVVTAVTGTAPTTQITVSPNLVTAKSASEVVVVKASHAMNVAFHRDAFALAMRPFAASDPMGLGTFMSQIDPVSGLALRLEVSRQHKRTRYSYDVLYGVKCVRPQLACRIAGE